MQKQASEGKGPRTARLGLGCFLGRELLTGTVRDQEGTLQRAQAGSLPGGRVPSHSLCPGLTGTAG